MLIIRFSTVGEDPLREYVRHCLTLGYAREQIRDRLLQAGYDVPTADSALYDEPVHFSAEPTLPGYQKMLIFTGIMTFLVVSGFALYYLQAFTPQVFDEPIFRAPEASVPSPTSTAPEPVTPKPIPTGLVPARLGSPDPPDRGKPFTPPASVACADYACMASAATSCAARQLVHNADLDFENLTANTTQIITIGNPTAEGCTVWIQTFTQEITFYEEYAREMSSLGLSESQIDALEANANAVAKAHMPAYSTCVVPRKELSEMFGVWKFNSFVTDALWKNECNVLYG